MQLLPTVSSSHTISFAWIYSLQRSGSIETENVRVNEEDNARGIIDNGMEDEIDIKRIRVQC